MWDAARAYAVSGALIAAVCALFTYHASEGYIRSPWLRALLTAALILLPRRPPRPDPGHRGPMDAPSRRRLVRLRGRASTNQASPTLTNNPPPYSAIDLFGMVGKPLITSLRDRESPNVVSERLGHASVAVTLSIYAHVMPGDQKAAAARFAALVRGASA